MSLETNRIQVDGSLNVDGSLYQWNTLFVGGGGGSGGGDVGWANNDVGSNNELITAAGDGSIWAESWLTGDFATKVLDVSGGITVHGTGKTINYAAGLTEKIGTETNIEDLQMISGSAATDTRGFAARNSSYQTQDYTYMYYKGTTGGEATTYGGLFFRQGNSNSDLRMDHNYLKWYNSDAGATSTQYFGVTPTEVDLLGTLTYGSNVLEFDSVASKTIRMKDTASPDTTPQSLSVLGAKGNGFTTTLTTTIGTTLYYGYGYEGGDVTVQAGDGADVSFPGGGVPIFTGGKGGDLLLYAGDGGTPDGGSTGLEGDVNIRGNIVNIQSAVVDIEDKLRHEGETDNYIQFTTDTQKFNAGNIFDNEQLILSSVGSVFNEDGQAAYDFRVEGDTEEYLIYADAGTEQVHLGALGDGTIAARLGYAQVTVGNDYAWSTGATTNTDNIFCYAYNRTEGAGNMGATISFSGPGHGGTPATVNRRHTAFGGMQTGSDDDQIGFSWWGHNGTSSTVAITESMRLSHTGQLDVLANVVAYSTVPSDIRLKENIENLENPLDKILQLRGVNYILKHNGLFQAGLVAQEVEDIIPEVVSSTTLPLITGNNEETYKVVSYDTLVPYLIEATKEQQTIINGQQKQIDELSEKVELLMKHIK